MLFTSYIFLFLFLPILITLYFLIPEKYVKTENIILLVFSLAFYTWGEKLGVVLLLFEILIAWGGGCLLERYKKKSLLWLCIISVLLLLVYFKYAGFITTNLGLILPIKALEIALPIGISFFSFQVISYLIDCYYDKIQKQGSLLDVALYVSMFPQLIAGPIVRYVDIEKQLHRRKRSLTNFYDGCSRFMVGLAKKTLIANQLAFVHEYAVGGRTEYSMSALWLGSIAYTLYIYFDFSGYSDMAIGLGQIFGFSYPQNFDDPYCALTVTDFWRRWHITLSSWFRDYVYIPLGGNRKGRKRSYINLFVVWLLTGIWHGANWTFIVWGLLYFCLLVIERIFDMSKVNKVVLHIYTLLMVNFLWIFFSADSLKDTVEYIGGMFGRYGFTLWDDASYFMLRQFGITFVIAILGCIPAVRSIIKALGDKNKVTHSLIIGGKIIVWILTFTYVIKGSYNPFIYFNF